MNNEVTSIVYSRNDGRAPVRFILGEHRRVLGILEGKMEKHGCEPILVVSKANPNEWWLDDICMVGDLMGADELIGDGPIGEDPFNNFLATSQNLKEGASMTYRVNGIAVHATASTDPCDEAHGTCTNNCEPIDL